MKFFFDLDGTLIDSSHRMHILFRRLVPECLWEYPDYWEKKRMGITHRRLLDEYFNYSGEAIENFEVQWMQSIEAKELLELDKLKAGVNILLTRLSRMHSLYVVSARQNLENTLYQLNQLQILSLFKKIILTKQKISKEKAIIQHFGSQLNVNDILIGDTAEDIYSGKKLGITTIAVIDGFRDGSLLNQALPDYLISTINDLIVFYD